MVISSYNRKNRDPCPRYHCRLFRATMYTTVVPESLGGRGLAKLLADKAFDFAVHEQVAKSIPLD